MVRSGIPADTHPAGPHCSPSFLYKEPGVPCAQSGAGSFARREPRVLCRESSESNEDQQDGYQQGCQTEPLKKHITDECADDSDEVLRFPLRTDGIEAGVSSVVGE